MKFFAALVALLLLAAPAALAQLPNVQLPSLPGQLPGAIGETAQTARAAAQELADVRGDLVRDLIRANRDRLEADPDGAAIVRSEVLAWAPSAAALEAARQAGFSILRQTELEELDAMLVVLRAPDGMSTRRALRRLRTLDPAGSYDFNHLYQTSGQSGGSGAPAQVGAGDASATRVGLIDSGVDTDHPVFAGGRIVARGFNGVAGASAHGTATASLLVGRARGFRGAAPGAQLYAADVYCGSAIGGGADAVVQALAWMARERVGVVNVSLVGPANRTLELAVRAMIARGHIIVAAVGNDGPAAAPLYPASYPGVVGVTAVDARRRALLEAARGAQVDFAAPGSDMRAAALGGAYSSVRGTSYAAPIVAGLLARELTAPDPARAQRIVAQLSTRATDLGARGADRTFGAGLIGEDVRVEERRSAS